MKSSPRDGVTASGDSRSNRRDLLKKTLALGTAGYVAPMIVGSVTTVSAQVISGALVCSVVDTCATFSCIGGCACVNTTEGATICIQPTCVVACTTSADCPSGHVCFTLGCCGPGTFCVPLCSGASPNQRAVPWAR